MRGAGINTTRTSDSRRADWQKDDDDADDADDADDDDDDERWWETAGKPGSLDATCSSSPWARSHALTQEHVLTQLVHLGVYDTESFWST